MTQQPFYPPQYPQAPAPPQQAYPQPTPPGFPQAQQFPGYPPQQVAYPQPPAQAPAQPLAQGSLDDYYSQPSASTGPSISWSDANRQPKPIGTAYAGIVARDVTNADVQQQTDFNTKAPLFYRDGRPKFAMKVPLKVQPSPEFPDGEATWYVKGQARDELVRAMAEAGASGAPAAGAGIVITLVGRRNSGAGLNPANVVSVKYLPQNGSGAPSPAPEPIPQPQGQVVDMSQLAPQQQAPQIVQPDPAQFQQPQVPTMQQAPPLAPPAPPQFQQQAPAPQVQTQAPQAAPQPPSDLSPDQQALLAKLTGGQG